MGMGKSAVFDIYKKNMRNFAGFLTFLFLANLGFMVWGGERVSALYVPTLSASIGQTNLQVNGNQVINSTSKTTEIPLNLLVNTNNKTGYTATLNTETDETALVNAGSATNAKIESIDTDKALTNFSSNTWGVKFGSSVIFSPIPALSSPVQILQTTEKSKGNEVNNLKIGMKLGDNLESGSYNNKLIFSILTNNNQHIAILTRGSEFKAKLKALGTTTDKIEHFKKSSTAPDSAINTVNIDDEDSDYEIKLWLDSTDKTAYYYAESEKVYLNKDSSWMFTYDWGEEKTKNIIDVDLSSFDTSQVTSMSYMLSSISKLTSLNLSNFDTSKVTNMSNMFSSMSGLTSLNLSSFDTSKVINMSGMFRSMSNLTSLDLSNFNTFKVTDMSAMFYDMSNLTSLNLSNFDTSQVTNMSYMFGYSYNLTELDLSSFDTSNTKTINSMFEIASYDMAKDKLEKIYVSNDFTTSKMTSYSRVFGNRKKLRGGNGSFLTDPNIADLSWLRIDRPGMQGYFTRKP